MAHAPRNEPYDSMQSSLLSETANEIKELNELEMKCAICLKIKKKLYLCDYNNCPQRGRLICKGCGKNTHSSDSDSDKEDEDDNDDADDAKQGAQNGIYHEFNPSNPYIRLITAQVLMKLSSKDKDQIRASAKEMALMTYTRDENAISSARHGFLLMGTNAVNSILALEKIGRYVPNAVYWKDVGDTLLQAVKSTDVKKFGTQIKTTLFDMGDQALEITQSCKEGAFVAAGVMLGCEIAYHTFRLIAGKMTLKQYGKKVATATAVSAGGVVGNIGGSAVGAYIGTFICPGAGTAIGGALGGLLGAIFVGLKAKESMDGLSWFNDKNDQKYRNELLKEALIAFDFELKDLNDPNVFNAAEIAKKYKIRAKECHPDMKGGSQEKFLKLTSRMTILLAMIDQTPKQRNQAYQEIKQLAIMLPQI